MLLSAVGYYCTYMCTFVYVCVCVCVRVYVCSKKANKYNEYDLEKYDW